MWLFVGLGNPGQKYQNNRHNIGFMAMDEICHRHNFSSWSSKFQGEVADGKIGTEKVLLLKPQTFMNLSGQSVQAAMAFYKIHPDNVVVFYDELDLIPFKLRTKKGGGSGGHNGIKSIDSHIGQNYWRVRMGIGHPGDKNRVSGYVLNDFPNDQSRALEDLIYAVSKNVDYIINEDMDGFMTKVAEMAPPPQPEKEEKKEAQDGI